MKLWNRGGIEETTVDRLGRGSAIAVVGVGVPLRLWQKWTHLYYKEVVFSQVKVIQIYMYML